MRLLHLLPLVLLSLWLQPEVAHADPPDDEPPASRPRATSPAESADQRIPETPVSAPQREPLRLELDPATLEALDPERQALVRAIAETMEKQLSFWATYPIVLPPSAFADRGQLIAMEELFQAPTDSELDEVARGPDGKLKRLSPEQRKQVREEALFVVPSQRYPGQNHVWKLTILLQKGRRNILATLGESNARELRHLIVALPDRFVGTDPVSVRHGFKNIFYGLRDTIGLLIGLVEEQPRYSDSQVRELLALERKKAVALKLEPATAAGPPPDQWVALDGTRIDLRLYDGDLMSKARPRLEDLFRQADADWQRIAVDQREKLLDRLSKEKVPEDQLAQRLADLAIDTRQERFYRLVLDDPQLEALSPGIGALLVRFGRALSIALEADRRWQRQLLDERARATAALTESHPTRARIPDWRDPRVEAAVLQWTEAHQWDRYVATLEALRAAGLAQEAWIFEAQLRIQREEEAGLRASLLAQRQPARTFDWNRRIWKPKNWTVVRTEIDVEDEVGTHKEARYHAETSRTHLVRTDVPFWRIGNLWWRSVAVVNNSLYALLVQNAWNGPLGVKSLFLPRPFHAAWKVDALSGQRMRDPDSLTPTMTSRVRALWQDVRESRAEFESKPDTGFIGKSFTRVLNKGWNYIVKGGFGTFLVVVGQPALTVINLGSTSALSLSAPVWGPGASAAVTGFNIAIYDTESPHQPRDVRAFPLIAHTVGRAGFGGAGQVALGLGLGGVYEPTAALLGGTLGGLRAVGRTFYDSLTYGLIIRRLGRIPARDGFLARRVEGPGLSSAFYFQIRPEIALLALQAHLEREELKLYEARTRAEIRDPVDEFNRFLDEVLSPFVASTVPAQAAGRKLSARTAAHLDRLDKAVNARRRALDGVLEIPYREKIRMTREDLETTLARSTPIVRHFYQSNILPRMAPESVELFWSQRSLARGDWPKLTRQLLAGVFAASLLEPLEDADRHMRLVVEHLDLRAYMEAIEEGVGPGDDLAKVRITRMEPEKEVAPSRVLVGPDQIFGAEGHGLPDGLELLGHGLSLDDLRRAKGLEAE